MGYIQMWFDCFSIMFASVIIVVDDDVVNVVIDAVVVVVVVGAIALLMMIKIIDNDENIYDHGLIQGHTSRRLWMNPATPSLPPHQTDLSGSGTCPLSRHPPPPPHQEGRRQAAVHDQAK